MIDFDTTYGVTTLCLTAIWIVLYPVYLSFGDNAKNMSSYDIITNYFGGAILLLLLGALALYISLIVGIVFGIPFLTLKLIRGK